MKIDIGWSWIIPLLWVIPFLLLVLWQAGHASGYVKGLEDGIKIQVQQKGRP